ncbi:hypothetical protein [Chromobacterium sphagni]|uniref:Uncharacterized protein n=1 Tax=Chromobacterium sphagni TaxID=1903179 RepID=A0A1S1X5W5_9NEIS|nr:hypothetical protein [Chromobacterium sphagni]OHX14807.1 hypothetical protein BI347_15805 [Chromobacterium sphagni]OHX15097.1 hypothetical protein BI344_22225 [Chromobacterium sphagni]
MENTVWRDMLAYWFADEEGDVSVPESWALENGGRIGREAPQASFQDGVWFRLHGFLPSHLLLARLIDMPHDSLLSLCDWARAHPRTMLFRKLERVPAQIQRWQADFDYRRGELEQVLGDAELAAQVLPPATLQ